MQIKWCPKCGSCFKNSESECPVCRIKFIDISLEPQPTKQDKEEIKK